MLKIFNTESRKVETFKPVKGSLVYIYSCGPTVYDYAHIGNLSTYIYSDLLKRYLKYMNYTVIDAMNITDIDDKIIKKSQEDNIPFQEFTRAYADHFLNDLEKLNIQIPDHICFATDYVEKMIAHIENLINKGYAYKTKDGSVYFKITSFNKYGRLSHLNKRQLKEGASGRVHKDHYNKETVSDFVLWKAWHKEDGEIYWDSPFGKGRPGWHIECSVMSMESLGSSTLDIHTGAIDLIFPHHENEIAQSEALTNKQFVKHWFHSGHLKIHGRKMSKSSSNFYTLKDILSKTDTPLAFRYLVLSGHYRQNLNFTFKSLESAEQALKKMNDFIWRIKESKDTYPKDKEINLIENVKNIISSTRKDITSHMNNDINSPQAIASIFIFINSINSLIDQKRFSHKCSIQVLNFVKEINSIFGFLDSNPRKINEATLKKIQQLIDKRSVSRKNEDWKEADKIRDQLSDLGVKIKDTDNETTWWI